MEQIQIAFGLPNEIASAKMIRNQNIKAVVRSFNGDSNFFENISEVLHPGILAPYLFIHCLDYILRTSNK